MGYNATVVVLLDRLDEIEKDPEFGKKLSAAIRYKASHRHAKRGDLGYQPCGDEATGQTQVVSVEHADYTQIVAVGGNCGRLLGYSDEHQFPKDYQAAKAVLQYGPKDRP